LINNIPFFRRLKLGYYWSQSQHRYAIKNYPGALAYYRKMIKIKPPKLHEKAYCGTLLVLLEDSKAARVEFSEVIDKISKHHKKTENENVTYVEKYSRMYLSMIDGKADYKTYWQTARSLSPKEDLMSWLRLPDESDMDYIDKLR